MGGCMSSPKDLAMEGEAPVEIPVSSMASEAEPLVQEEKEEAKVDEVEKKEEGLVEVSAAAEEAKPKEAETEAEEAKPVEAEAEAEAAPAPAPLVESDKSDAPLITF